MATSDKNEAKASEVKADRNQNSTPPEMCASYRIPNQPLAYAENALAEARKIRGSVGKVLAVGGTLYATHLKGTAPELEIDSVEMNSLCAQYQLILAKMVEEGKPLKDALDILCYPKGALELMDQPQEDEYTDKYDHAYEYKIETKELLEKLPEIRKYWDKVCHGKSEKDFANFIAHAVLNSPGTRTCDTAWITGNDARAPDLYEKYMSEEMGKKTPVEFDSLAELDGLLKSGKFVWTGHGGNEVREDYLVPRHIAQLKPNTEINVATEDVMKFSPDKKYDFILSNNVWQWVSDSDLEKNGKFFSKAADMLNPNGVLEVSDLTACNTHITSTESGEQVLKNFSKMRGIDSRLKFIREVSLFGGNGYSYYIFQKVA